jgi:hypothetical protein
MDCKNPRPGFNEEAVSIYAKNESAIHRHIVGSSGKLSVAALVWKL